MDARYSVPVKDFFEDHSPTRKMGTLSFSGIKRLRRAADYPYLCSAEDSNGLALFSHLPSVSAQICHGVTLPFTFNGISALHTAVLRPVAIFEMLVLLCYEVQVSSEPPPPPKCTLL